MHSLGCVFAVLAFSLTLGAGCAATYQDWRIDGGAHDHYVHGGDVSLTMAAVPAERCVRGRQVRLAIAIRNDGDTAVTLLDDVGLGTWFAGSGEGRLAVSDAPVEGDEVCIDGERGKHTLAPHTTWIREVSVAPMELPLPEPLLPEECYAAVTVHLAFVAKGAGCGPLHYAETGLTVRDVMSADTRQASDLPPPNPMPDVGDPGLQRLVSQVYGWERRVTGVDIQELQSDSTQAIGTGSLADALRYARELAGVPLAQVLATMAADSRAAIRRWSRTHAAASAHDRDAAARIDGDLAAAIERPLGNPRR